MGVNVFDYNQFDELTTKRIVDEQTFTNWKRRGEKETAGLYFGFLGAVKKAEVQAIARNVTVIQTAARDSWQAAAWWLERKHPQEWGRTRLEPFADPDSVPVIDPKQKLLDKLDDIASRDEP